MPKACSSWRTIGLNACSVSDPITAAERPRAARGVEGLANRPGMARKYQVRRQTVRTCRPVLATYSIELECLRTGIARRLTDSELLKMVFTPRQNLALFAKSCWFGRAVVELDDLRAMRFADEHGVSVIGTPVFSRREAGCSRGWVAMWRLRAAACGRRDDARSRR